MLRDILATVVFVNQMQLVLAAVQVIEEVVQEGAHLLLKTRNCLRTLDPRKTSALLVIP